MALTDLVEKTLEDGTPSVVLKPRPWWLKIGFIIGGIIILVLLVFALTEPLSYPKNVSVSNVSSNSITLSWTTAVPMTSSVRLVEPGISEYLPPFFYASIGDDQDRSGKLENKHLTHYVTFKNLKPNTHYVAKIYSGLRQIAEQKLTTGPIVPLQSPNLVYGRVINADKKAVPGVLVYLRLQQTPASGSALLSSMTDANGKWSIETSNARVRDLQKSFNWQKSAYELLIVDDGAGNRFKATANSKSDKPWPTVVLQASASGRLQK